jgi:hypothetical protein
MLVRLAGPPVPGFNSRVVHSWGEHFLDEVILRVSVMFVHLARRLQ